MAASGASHGTRSQSNVWLIGQLEEKLPDNVLPTIVDVLKTFFFHHISLKLSVSKSMQVTVEELMNIWNRARIPTALKQNIITKLKCLIDEYNLLKKNKCRKSEAQRSRVSSFCVKIKVLFDIANKDSDALIKINEDKVFLADQRSFRKMKMAGVDKDLALKEERAEQRRKIEEDRKDREEQRLVAFAGPSTSTVSNQQHLETSDDSGEEEGSDFEIEIPIHYRRQLNQDQVQTDDSLASSTPKSSRILQNMLSSPEVSSALDRINVSDNKFTILAAAIAKADGQNLSDGSLSRSTVRRKRTAHRAEIESNVRSEFIAEAKSTLVVHWDGKLMKDTTSREKSKSQVDRIAVVVTGFEVEKVLGIAKAPSGSGETQAKAVIQLLQLWEAFDDVVGMSFDTTASNTGVKNGACILLEKNLGRNMLYLACRHHIHEIIISGVFGKLFGPSTGPAVPLFQRFQQYWPNIDQQSYCPLDDQRLDSDAYLKPLRDDVTGFLTNVLKNKGSFIPRDDYKEIIELCIIILGGFPEGRDYHFKVPGAYHMARWMAKVIYCFKIYLFRKQFKLTEKEQRCLKEFCLFSSLIYVTAWVKCPLPSDAAVNDLQLFKQLKRYSEVNQTISDAAIKKFSNHLWYLGPELIPLALFSANITDDDKRAIVANMRKYGEDWQMRGTKLNNTNELENKSLPDLVTAASTSALRSVLINIDFIFNSDPETWKECKQFQDSKRIVDSLKVVNDVAERSIALMSSVNESITRKESEMQKLIQIVEDHRKRVPSAKKSILKTSMTR